MVAIEDGLPGPTVRPLKAGIATNISTIVMVDRAGAMYLSTQFGRAWSRTNAAPRLIALDTTALAVLFLENATLHRAGTNNPIKHAKERLEALVDRIAQSNDQILISTPALSELLVQVPRVGINHLIAKFNGSVWFRVESFDTAAAIEVATRLAEAIAAGDKREGLPVTTPWTKVRVIGEETLSSTGAFNLHHSEA
jgi:hypothetical protein